MQHGTAKRTCYAADQSIGPRVHTMPADTRAHTMPADTRAHTMPADTRAHTMPADRACWRMHACMSTLIARKRIREAAHRGDFKTMRSLLQGTEPVQLARY
jgi:hypothetical protein